MRVLVTGAFGNLGRCAVASLAPKHQVRALSHRLDRGDRSLARRFGPSVEVVRGDVRDRAAMDAALRGVDVVAHLAFLIPPPALARPALAVSINLDGTRTVTAAARAAGARILFASTLDVYGPTLHLPPPRAASAIPPAPSTSTPGTRSSVRSSSPGPTPRFFASPTFHPSPSGCRTR